MRSPLLYLGVLAVLVLFTALIAPMFIDWTSYRAEFERYGSKLAGREVRIEGPVGIQILPTPTIRLNGLRIANPDGATAEEFVSAETLELRLAISPLLKGKIEVEALEFEGATFEFEHLGDSRGSWHLDQRSSLVEFLTADNIGVTSATISESTIVLRDRVRGGRAQLDDVYLEISASSLVGPYRARGTVKHEDKLLFVSMQTGRRAPSGDMRLSVTLEPDGEYTPTYGFSGKLAGRGADARFEGKLRISRDLPPLVEDAPQLDPAEVGLPFSFKAVVSAGFSEVSLADVKLLVDQTQPGSVIEGEMRIALGDRLGLDMDLSARHLNLDRIAEHSGLTPADLAPGLQLVDSISRLVGAAPEDLEGRIRLAANALTVGGETVESALVRAEISGKSLIISDAGGVLPGRSEVKLTDLRLAVRSGVPGFEGNLDFASRDTRGFVKWALPGLAEAMDAAPRAFKGKSSVKGQIAIDARSVGLRQTRFEVDGSTVQGAVVVVPGDVPEILSNLTAADVNFDRYFPAGGTRAEPDSPADPFATLVSGIDASALSAFNGRFVIETGTFRRWRLAGERLRASVEVRNGALILQEADIGGFNGVNLRLVGAVEWRAGSPHGSLTADIQSGSMRRVLEIPVLRQMVTAGIGERVALFHEEVPVTLHVDLDSESRKGSDRITATVEGDVDGARVQFTVAFRGDWTGFEKGDLKLDGMITSPGVDVLARLFSIKMPAGATASSNESTLNVSLTGSLEKGLGGALVVNAFNSQLDISGLMMLQDGALSVESEVSANSTDASELLQALGLLSGEPAFPTAVNLKGLLSATGNEIVVTGIGGKIAGIPVGLDGTMDVSGVRPKLFANLTLARLDLPWAIGRLLALPPEPAPGQAHSVPGTEWSAAPFDFRLLDAADMNVILRAGDVTLLGKAAAAQLRAEVSVSDGEVKVERFTSELAGGELSADARLTTLNGQLALEASFELQGAGFAATLRSPDGPAPLSGRYTLSGRLQGAGRSPVGFVSSLSGDGAIKIDKGALYGVNPGPFSEALQEANSASELDSIIEGTLVDGEMDFAGLSSKFEISNGVVRFENAEIEGPAATGNVGGVLDIPAWRLDSKWSVALKTFPEAPPLTVLLAGPAAELVRSYDTTALRSFFVVKGLTEGVQQLEKLQREEQERIKRLEEMEREARLRRERLEAERREAERIEAEKKRKAEEKLRAAREAEARRAAEEAERLARQNAIDSETLSEALPDGDAPETDTTGEAPKILLRIPREPLLEPERRETVSRVAPDVNGVDQLPLPEELPAEEPLGEPQVLQPLPPLDQAVDGENDVDVLALDPIDPEAEEDLEGEPLSIAPNARTLDAQDNVFSDNPASWRK